MNVFLCLDVLLCASLLEVRLRSLCGFARLPSCCQVARNADATTPLASLSVTMRHSHISTAVLILFRVSLDSVVALDCRKSSSSFESLRSSSSSVLASPSALALVRGGANQAGGKKSTKKKKKKTEKSQINEALKEKDAAEALGDAIRDRAEILRRDDINDSVSSVDDSIQSLGWALGASDYRQSTSTTSSTTNDGGVEVTPAPVLVNYFLKSHGGAHALQSLCSLLATVAGLAAISVPNKALQLDLIKRTCVFAMIKHVSGLLAATFLTAREIPEIGLRRARLWMEDLAKDPVSQYIFYAACIIVWLPINQDAWWLAYPVMPSILVGPILVREIVSTMLVISDVLVLWSCSSASVGSKTLIKKLLTVVNAFTSAIMCILVTPAVWKPANVAERQAILAKLVSRFSISMEVVVGIVMLLDAIWAVVAFFFASSQRPSALQMAKRLLCARLYLQFLWTRRKKIGRLATKIRGGAIGLPFYLLDVLMDPLHSMGIEREHRADDDDVANAPAWMNILRSAVELDDNDGQRTKATKK